MQRQSLILLGPAVLTLAGHLFAADDTNNVKLAAAAKNVRQIVAHRGASTERPECTLASIWRAIEVHATAVEVDVRTSKDGHLVILHDNTLDRTTNGKGPVGAKTLAELRALDAGSKFDKKYRNERIPTLREVLELCNGKIDVLLDLKEQGDAYDRKVVAAVRKYGDAKRIIVGVRTVDQAKRFRRLLPKARQLGLIPKPADIEVFAKVGVETIRLWPRWLTDAKLIPRVRKAGAKLHLNGTAGTVQETVPLLKHNPDSLSSDDPGRLRKTLKSLVDRERVPKPTRKLIPLNRP